MHGACEAHEVLPGGGVAREELGRQQRPFHLIAGLTGGDEVAREVTASSGERDHVIQGGKFGGESVAAIDTSPSAITKGRAFDLALVLLVLDAASVAGNTPRGAGERDVVHDPT